MNRFHPHKGPLMVVALSFLTVLPAAHGAITSASGAVLPGPPPASVAVGVTESDTTIIAFAERRNRVLTAPLALDVTTVGVYDAASPALTPGVVPAGTTISSYFVHGDAIGGGSVTLGGAIGVNENILGIIVTDAGLDASDALLGAGGTAYATGSGFRGLNFATDKMALLPSRRDIQITFPINGVTDQIRIITATPTPPGMTFSMDFQGPSRGAIGPWGTSVFEGDIMTPSNNPPLGPWRPSFLPPSPPGPVIKSAGAGGFRLGLVPGSAGITEVDALSYGNDSGTRARFSVDEWARGAGGAVNGVVAEQSPPFPVAEAAADIFTYLSDLFTPTLMGNVQFSDGNGDTWPGVGLIEANVAAPGQPDSGDNLDAVDFDTRTGQLTGPVYLSLDSAFADPLEGMLANAGTAVANGFVGGDVVVVNDTVSGPVPVLYAAANALGLDLVQGRQPDSDDLDALALSENGDGVFNPQYGVFNDSTDWILFSVRRGSAVIGRPDSRLGIPIDAGDILTIPAPGGSPFPAIVVRAESLGLSSFRIDPLCGVTGSMDVSAGCDELDALDTVEAANVDSDGDGFYNDVDNCATVVNPAQIDADGDGYGNLCDADFNNDCVINTADLAIFRAGFFGTNPVLDLDSDGTVAFSDLALLRGMFFMAPGPGLGFCP